ncbi:MAG: hypothetical protein AAGJ82_10760, partial [Bacteroidota bacterium]
MKTIFLPTLFTLICTMSLAQDFQRVPLHDGWQLRSADHPEGATLPAKVPGLVQEELIRSGLLPDPYYGTNEKLVQWVSEQNWAYELNWEIAKLDDNRHYQLNFRGLDTYAAVSLNGQNILAADNMFRSWQVPVNGILREGTNRLRIVFTAPVNQLRPVIDTFAYPLHQTSVNDTGEPRVANFARKAQFQFGWDWGLRLVTMGIWRPVYLESWAKAKLTDAQFHQNSLSQEVAEMTVKVKIDRREPGQYEIRVRGIDEKGQTYTRRPLLDSENELDINFRIDQPQYWWPVGHGPQNRYHLACQLWKDGELV